MAKIDQTADDRDQAGNHDRLRCRNGKAAAPSIHRERWKWPRRKPFDDLPRSDFS
jgi:hypothetical protein